MIYHVYLTPSGPPIKVVADYLRYKRRDVAQLIGRHGTVVRTFKNPARVVPAEIDRTEVSDVK